MRYRNPRILVAAAWLLTGSALAQAPAEPAPASVEVQPAASDSKIAKRLTRILNAAGWFEDVQIRSDQGIVFVEGRAESEERKTWAGDLARKTEGVVAVVNNMTVPESSPWDVSPAWGQIRQIGSAAVKRSPLYLLALFVLAGTWLVTVWAARSSLSVMRLRLENELLRTVASRAIAAPVLLLGCYVALKIAGLTGLAVTVLGGTGLVGLIVGFAFRDIAENFLASLMLSMQNPFARGDRIKVAGYEGFVQSVNTRSTLLITLEGNHVQIPNATVYKETITNFTANPNTRFDFTVGIGFGDSVERAQVIAKSVVSGQEGVMTDPEPWALVENLGSASIGLRIFFWVDTNKYNGLKIRSATIRAVKNAFEAGGVTMPDEAREAGAPSDAPVRTTPEEEGGEGDLTTEAVGIEQQAQRARAPESGPNLLKKS